MTGLCPTRPACGRLDLGAQRWHGRALSLELPSARAPWLCWGVLCHTPVLSAISRPGVWRPRPGTSLTALFPGEGSSWPPVGHMSWASCVHAVWLQHPHWPWMPPWMPVVWRQLGSRGAQAGPPHTRAHAACVSAGAGLVPATLQQLLSSPRVFGPVSAATQPSVAGVAVMVTEAVAEPTDPSGTDTVMDHTSLFLEPPVRATPRFLELRAPAFICCHPVHILSMPLGTASCWPGSVLVPPPL